MAQILKGRHDISAIQILSHGSEANLYLGTADLNATSMATTYAADLAVIKHALAPNADLLVYGCDFAKGADGAAAAVELSRLTGASVAASIDITGAAKLGGNWVLEDNVGAIHTKSIVDASYAYELAVVMVADPTTTDGGSGDTVTANAAYETATANTALSASIAGDAISSGAYAITYSKASDPSHGTLTLNSNGIYTYTPTSNYVGTDTFTYQATDTNGVSATNTVTITVADVVTASPANKTTNANTRLNGMLVGLATDAAGQTLTYSKVSGPSNGTLSITTGGLFVYRPVTNYTGTDTFTYKATDTSGYSATNTVTISVNDVAPIITAHDSGSTALNSSLSDWLHRTYQALLAFR